MTECRFPEKRTYRTRELAREGMRQIRFAVGERYDTLYPYRCPDESHWHLSHYRQGRAVCPVCGKLVPSWFGGKVWIIAVHTRGLWPRPCAGEGMRAL